MPDWSYQNVFQPLLFRLPAAQARDFTLGAMGKLASHPLGRSLIAFMGHMQPPATAGATFLGWNLESRVMLGAGVDPHGLGGSALSRFGIGILEFGAVSLHGQTGLDEIERNTQYDRLELKSLTGSLSLEVAQSRLVALDTGAAKCLVRLAADAPLEVLQALQSHADGFTIMPPLEWFSSNTNLEFPSHWQGLLSSCQKPMLLLLPITLKENQLQDIVEKALAIGFQGFALLDALAIQERWHISSNALAYSAQTVRRIRQFSQASIIACGVYSPDNALELDRAGANCVSVHAGLIFHGPGLPKRINNAFAALNSSQQNPQTLSLSAGWTWLMLLGFGMIFSGLLVNLVGMTRATLPYDEVFLGIARADLENINPLLLDFLRHDRVTLAATMMSVGTLYTFLAFFGIRHGMHWAWNSFRLSASIGFLSFFLFLLYGYFDWLHALASIILLPFFWIGIRKKLPTPVYDHPRDVKNDAIWRAGLIGQFFFVATGIGLILAGMTIAGLGAIAVFVPQDLEFMQTTRETLQAANSKLIALIAHDRSGFGGALWSTGVAVLTSSLWGFERGRSWVWWMLLLAGSIGFVFTLGIHFWVGYSSFVHLLPAYIGFCFFSLGLVLSKPFLFNSR